ncbi:MAG: hypothetical protein JXC33_08260 [Deltaproteobacteria bacterium]|nr:hypothetical protein [Deltaproteobacteria bacterium]
MKKICFIYIVAFVFCFVSSSFALTAEQIIQLKKAGVSDETIQIMLKQEKKFPRKIKDDEGNEHIIYSTDVSSLDNKSDGTEDENVKRAWKMLENIIIDTRQ